MRIDWKNVISVDMEYPDEERTEDILYVEYKDDRLEKVVYPRGIPSDELLEILNLADKKKIDLRVIEENSEEKKLNEDILAAQKFNDETEALVIDGNGDEKIAYVKKYDGTVEKVPYSEDMNRFIYENLEAKKHGRSSKFFEISNDPEVAKGQVKALEEVIAKKNNQTPVDNSTHSDEEKDLNTKTKKKNSSGVRNFVEMAKFYLDPSEFPEYFDSDTEEPIEESKEDKTDLKDVETDGYRIKNNPTHEKDSEKEKLNEAAAQKFNDETETLVIDGNGDKKVAYVKKYDGTVEKIPYSKDMDKFISEQKAAKERGERPRFFEISNDPEVAKGQVKALEEVIEKRNNQTPVDNSTYSDELVEEENKENRTDLKDIETDGYETKNSPAHEEDSEKEKLNEAAAQKFNDETEGLAIDENGIAYVKKYDGTVEKIPYSKYMDKFISEQKAAKERGESSRFFEFSNDPEVAKEQVESLEKLVAENNNQTSVDNSTYSDELAEAEEENKKEEVENTPTADSILDSDNKKNIDAEDKDVNLYSDRDDSPKDYSDSFNYFDSDSDNENNINPEDEDINIYSGRDDSPEDYSDSFNYFDSDSDNENNINPEDEDINIYSDRDDSSEDYSDSFNYFDSDSDEEKNINTDVEDQNFDTEANELNDDEVENEDELNTRADKLEKNYNKKKAAKIAIGVAAGVLGATGIAAAVTSCNKNTNKNKNEESTSKSFESLMNSMKKDDERRVFAENVFSVTEALNSKALDKDVFALEEDGEATLHFTYDEVAAAKLVLNNYTSEEMYKIFGTDEIDTNDIMVKYQSFTTKMSLYAMNGKAPSGVASLIENEANRTWFEKIENSIVEFNKAPNSTNADKVIRTFAYFYNHGINGSDGIENDEATLSCVKNLAFNMIRGYRDANGEKDYQQYLVVSTEPGSFDDQYRTNKESQVQKGERLSDHIKIAESGPCTIQNVRSHIESLVERLATGRIENKDKKEKSSRPSYTEIRKAAASTIDSNMEIEDDVLYMNRIRGLTKIDSKDESEYTVTKEVWDKMTTEERLDFAKKNGKVISNTKKTTTEKVDASKLTDKEKEEADKQKTYEVNGHKFNSLECKEAYKEGYLAAHNYANEVGAYKHSAIYNSMDIDNSYVVIEEDAGTLNDVAKNRYAYEGRETLLSDSQIQRRLEKDVNNYKNSGSNINDNMVNAYKLGWTESMNTALEADKQNGKAEREEAERLYKEAQEEAKRENEKTPTKDENEKPGSDVDEPNIPTFDENDDPYLDGPDPDIVDPDTVGKEYSAIPEAEVKNYQSSTNNTNDTIDKTTEISEENTSSNDEYEADEMPDLDIEVSEADLDSYFDSYINNNEEVKTLSLKR